MWNVASYAVVVLHVLYLVYDAGHAGRVDLAATNLNQETAGFVLGKNAYRDEALSATNPNPSSSPPNTAAGWATSRLRRPCRNSTPSCAAAAAW